MGKHRCRIGVQKTALPCLLFTLDQLIFLKKILCKLECVMQQQSQPLPNLAFAVATYTQLQTKIDQMIRRRYFEEGIELDHNEVIILQTSVWIYMVELSKYPPLSEEQERCQTLDALLSPITKRKIILN